jgi:hypothetical protein
VGLQHKLYNARLNDNHFVLSAALTFGLLTMTSKFGHRSGMRNRFAVRIWWCRTCSFEVGDARGRGSPRRPAEFFSSDQSARSAPSQMRTAIADRINVVTSAFMRAAFRPTVSLPLPEEVVIWGVDHKQGCASCATVQLPLPLWSLAVAIRMLCAPNAFTGGCWRP